MIKKYKITYIDTKDESYHTTTRYADSVNTIAMLMKREGFLMCSAIEDLDKDIVLTTDEVVSLKKLIDEIDYEESLEDSDELECDCDVIIEDLYKICDIVRKALGR